MFATMAGAGLRKLEVRAVATGKKPRIKAHIPMDDFRVGANGQIFRFSTTYFLRDRDGIGRGGSTGTRRAHTQSERQYSTRRLHVSGEQA